AGGGAALTNVGASALSATGGVATGAAVVASFTDPGGSEPVGDYAATIQWGDGSAATAGTIVDLGNGQFNVTASHAFPDEGTFTFSVTVTHDQLPAVVVTGTARVADAPLTATAAPFVPLHAPPLRNPPLPTFLHPNPS